MIFILISLTNVHQFADIIPLSIVKSHSSLGQLVKSFLPEYQKVGQVL